MPQILKDPIFGDITFNNEQNCWQGIVLLDFNKKAFALNIVGDNESCPTAEQKALYTTFVQNSDVVKADLQQAFHRYYSALREGLMQTMPKEVTYFERDMPFIDNPEHIWNLVTPTTLLIQNPETYQEGDLALQWKCSWDIEHELLAVYKDQHLVEISI